MRVLHFMYIYRPSALNGKEEGPENWECAREWDVW